MVYESEEYDANRSSTVDVYSFNVLTQNSSYVHFAYKLLGTVMPY